MKKFAAILLIAAIGFPQSAIAQTSISRDSLGNVVIGNTGIAPGTLTIVDYNLAPKVKNFTTSGACNLLTVKSSSTFNGNRLDIGTTRFDVSSGQPPALVGAPCTNGVINPAYPWITVGVYKYVQGAGSTMAIISGATGTVSVATNPGKERLLKTDSCGRLVIRNNEKWKIEHANDGGELGYKAAAAGSSWTLVPYPATATTSTPPYICYKKTLYKPL